ncbi:hypothetical protein HF263_35490 [Rhizobium leguminosarum]|uniref:hypothetical protein n=2 Tax=Rhizobium leguminosarum TaxID=384 RepID=UPI001C9123F9|nr:hypothetical protein [Rhizobium leguminosarum]MBY3061276.1 hypothetical protein [Rhizobium leguminosarum]
MVVDEPRIGPEEFKFTVAGHKHAYYLTTLRPYYGEAFCCHFRDAWTKASGLIRGTTAIKYFQSARTAFELIAYNGTAKPRSPEGYILRLLRDKPGSQIDEKRWHPVAINLSRAILTIGDNSFIESENPTSRNKKLEALNAGFKWLHQGGMIPDIPLEGRLETRNHDSSKCLATLAFENARFGIAGLSANDAYQAFLTMNVDMLEEVRRCLCADLMDNYDKFKLGKVLMSDSTVPEISDVEDTLIAAVRWQLRQGKGCAILGLTREQGWVLALKILKHRASGGKPLHENLFYFARSMVSHADAQPYFEATTRTLNAAFHIILIDVGGNSQPIEDIPFKCYKSKASRGKIVLRSLRLDKNRAGGKRSKKRVRGEIASTVEEIELILPTKHHADRPSGIAVIDMYKELTASMRSQSGPTHERLWVWRVAWEAKVHTSLASVGMERWQDFLDRNADNHLIGGLPLTRQILRTSVANTRGERGEIDWVIQQAMLDHSSPGTTFEYLSEKAVRAYLNSQIRDFMNTLEAVGAVDIEHAAKVLGIPPEDLSKRALFGLENGLEFATGRTADETSRQDDADNKAPVLVAAAKSFSISDKAMKCLELARRALRDQFEWMLHTNPARLLRMWVPWLALCEGYCRVLGKSGNRVRFKKICSEIDAKLHAGEMRLPLVW